MDCSSRGASLASRSRGGTMDTTMDRPTTSPGDGRGEGGASKRTTARTDQPNPDVSSATPEGAPPAAQPGAELLSADGTPIPIGSPREKAARRGRELGRYASDSWKKISRSAEELGKTNPTGLALGSLAVGLVAGVI